MMELLRQVKRDMTVDDWGLIIKGIESMFLHKPPRILVDHDGELKYNKTKMRILEDVCQRFC